jgi:hypothetical protein
MAKSLDKVLQPDGTYKWELVEPGLSERMGNAPGTVCPAPQKLVPGELAIDETAPEKGILTANLKTMTKAELEIYGRSIGVELDKRHTKADLIAELEKFTSAS